MPFRLVQSLGFRLLIPLFLAVGAVLAVYATVSFQSTEDHFLHLVRADVQRTSALVKRATHDGMLLNKKEDVQATISRLSDAPEIAAIRIYDKEGKIVMSAHAEEIGRKVLADSGTCQACHQEDRPAANAILQPENLARVDVHGGVLRHLSVIENEPGCVASSCHAHTADKTVLGVLDLEMSMDTMTAALQTAKRQFLGATSILTVVILGVVAVFIRRGLQHPIARLCAGTRRIAEGDLDTRIQVRGHHELAQLAAAFNHMAEDLAAARREITQWSEMLEKKVEEKSEALNLAQRQVLHMEKMASLGKLSATVAHEINNPLSGMLVYAGLTRRELQQQTQLGAAVREELLRYLVLIEHECTRCGTIVQNLLLFARRRGAAMTTIDINEVVDQSLMLVQHHLEVNRLKLDAERLSGDSRMIGDAGQLQQAVVALLVNAVEAMSGMKEGRGVLTLRVNGTPDEIQIDVGDTGVGIPAEILSMIFEPFFSTKDAEKGVGLGLSVVYGIVQRHGGRVDVESKVGRGTVFHLRLPRKPPSLDQQPEGADTSAGV